MFTLLFDPPSNLWILDFGILLLKITLPKQILQAGINLGHLPPQSGPGAHDIPRPQRAARALLPRPRGAREGEVGSLWAVRGPFGASRFCAPTGSCPFSNHARGPFGEFVCSCLIFQFPVLSEFKRNYSSGKYVSIQSFQI